MGRWVIWSVWSIGGRWQAPSPPSSHRSSCRFSGLSPPHQRDTPFRVCSVCAVSLWYCISMRLLYRRCFGCHDVLCLSFTFWPMCAFHKGTHRPWDNHGGYKRVSFVRLEICEGPALPLQWYWVKMIYCSLILNYFSLSCMALMCLV